MSSSNLFKQFGEGANVMSQLATDKSLRRKTTTVQNEASVPDTREIAQATFTVSPTNSVPHSLGSVPSGAFVILSDVVGTFTCTAVSSSDVTFDSSAGAVVTVWIE